jgi:hypothetical protein
MRMPELHTQGFYAVSHQRRIEMQHEQYSLTRKAWKVTFSTVSFDTATLPCWLDQARIGL